MMREFLITDTCRRKMRKAIRKNPVLRDILENKINEILDNPERFKPLRHQNKTKRRVHILKSFVLIYEIRDGVVCILDFDHHDKAYRI